VLLLLYEGHAKNIVKLSEIVMSLQTDGNTIDSYSIANVSLLLNIVTQNVITVITVVTFF